MQGISQEVRALSLARRKRIEEMNREGYRTSSIALELGLSRSYVSKVLQALGVETVGGKLRGHVGRVDANGVMDRLVETTAPDATVSAFLDASWDDLDRACFTRWDGQLAKTIVQLRNLRARLNSKDMRHGNSTNCAGAAGVQRTEATAALTAEVGEM